MKKYSLTKKKKDWTGKTNKFIILITIASICQFIVMIYFVDLFIPIYLGVVGWYTLRLALDYI